METTTTTTTVRRTETTTIGVNVGFLSTPIGIIMIVEIILTLLAWTLLVSGGWYQFHPQLGFAAFAFVFSWLITLGLFVVFLLGLHATTCANFPWGTIQIACHATFVLLCFIGSCCVAGYPSTRYNSNYQASCAFGFIATIVFIVGLFFCFRKAYGRFPWEQSTGQPTNT